jgi:hypothetical protein
MRRTFYKVAFTAILLQGVAAFGQANLNYDPSATAPAPTLNLGWNYDQVNAVATPSVDSPYTYDFTTPVTFRITDQFNPGDVYQVFDNGNLILTTAFNGAQAPLTPVGNTTGEAGWENGAYSHGEVVLPAGLNVITVEGDGAGGIPAGFYDRIDGTVPDGGATGLLLVAGVLGLAGFRRTLS